MRGADGIQRRRSCLRDVGADRSRTSLWDAPSLRVEVQRWGVFIGGGLSVRAHLLGFRGLRVGMARPWEAVPSSIAV